MNKFLVDWLECSQLDENERIRAYLSRVANLPALPGTASTRLEQDLGERQGLLSGLDALCGINQDDAAPPSESAAHGDRPVHGRIKKIERRQMRNDKLFREAFPVGELSLV
jgi:hypothetical protein